MSEHSDLVAVVGSGSVGDVVGVGDVTGSKEHQVETGTLPEFTILDEKNYKEWMEKWMKNKNDFIVKINNVYLIKPVSLCELEKNERVMVGPDLYESDIYDYENYVTYTLSFERITFTTNDIEKGVPAYDDYIDETSYKFRIKFKVNGFDVIISIKATLDNASAGDLETFYWFEICDNIFVDIDNKVIKDNIGWIISKMHIVEIETNDIYNHSDSVWELQYEE